MAELDEAERRAIRERCEREGVINSDELIDMIEGGLGANKREKQVIANRFIAAVVLVLLGLAVPPAIGGIVLLVGIGMAIWGIKGIIEYVSS